MNSPTFDVATVTLNPAIDLTVTIENFAAGEVNRVAAQRSSAGGKGVNVAAALADSGHRVIATGFLGSENSGIFETLFDQKRITDRFVRVPGQTRFGLKITDPARGQTTDINFPGSEVTTEQLEHLVRRLETIPAQWFVLSGSVPPGVSPGVYGDLISQLQTRKRRVLVDASGEALRYAIKAAPDIIKPNLAELEMLLGHKLSGVEETLRAAQSLLKYGIKLVVVSMGEEGALFVSASECLRTIPPKVSVMSTVGAGDAMVAGILSARLRDQSLEETACLATAFSVSAITHAGTGLSSAEYVQALLPQVVIKPVL